ncbi:MAG TPA: ABC transporter permease [Acidothermaceae bacterium]|nr:ABC transporter permease [Acidothermaceae bacterium]
MSSPAVTQMAEMWRYRGLIGNFASRELKSKYKHSVLGWAWSLINPAATLAIYTLVFSTIFRATPPKAHNGMTTYVIYLFIALVAWNFFSNVVNGSMAALIGAGPLLKKIYFPAYAPVIGNSFSALVQTSIESGVLLVVLFGTDNISWSMLFTPIILLLLLVFASGIGLMFALFNVYYRDVSYLVTIVMQLLFYSTPVIWAPAQLLVRKHGHFAIEVLSKSPMYQYVEGFRDALWAGTVPSPSRWLWMVASALISITVGLLVFNHGARDVGEEL